MPKKFHFIAFLLLIGTSLMAQPRVSASLDTVRNPIGAQFNLMLRVQADSSSTVAFPTAKTFGAMEVIREYDIDTVRDGANVEWMRKYGLTQFDSGRYVVPPIKIFINGKPFETDSLALEIMPVAVDTLKQKMHDIKDIVPVEPASSRWWIWLLLTLAIAAAGFFAWRFRKHRKTEQHQFRSPMEKATVLLQQLERKELWQKGEVKHYYSELTDIARTYIEEAIHIPAMESTTTELIAALRATAQNRHMQLSPETVANLENVLRQADLVKFAKSRPADSDIAQDRQRIEKTLVTLDAAIPEEVEEEDLVQKREEERKRLEKGRKIRIAAIAAGILLLLVTTGFIAKYGARYVFDTVTGNDSKELLEGEWITSRYGNPAISVETPEVLLRMDASKLLPPESMALMKEFQFFAIGEPSGDFYVAVSTLSYKSDTEIDLNAAVEGAIETLELQGFKNMLVKQEEYDSPGGISGRRAYGTYEQSGSDKKMVYELLLFGQQNGLQQIIVAHRESDSYAVQMKERILQSAELKTAAP